MTTTRFADHLLEGIHSARPTATDVPGGTLYSCTTHSLVYQSNGATWSTWATLGTPVADILDLTTAEMDGSLVLAPDAAGGVEFRAETGGSGGGYEDLALWMPYTLDKNPSGSYPDKNYAKNGASQAGMLTAAGPPRFNADTFGGNMGLGWQRDVQLSPDIFVLVNIDFGAAVTIGVGRAYGTIAIGGSNVKHPSAFEVFYSDNGSAYSTFGTALSGMGEDPGSLTTTHWVCEVAATAVSHRYWRFKISAHSGGSDCFLFVSRVQLLGTR